MFSINKFTTATFVLVLSCYITLTLGLHDGKSTTRRQYPSHAVIRLPQDRICGATIISTNHILTASNCLFDENLELIPHGDVDIFIGGTGDKDSSVIVDALGLFPHPQFDPFSKENDLAIVRTSQHFPLSDSSDELPISVATVNKRIVADGFICTVPELTFTEHKSSLKYIEAPILNRLSCMAGSPFQYRIRETMICAGKLNEASNLCPEDIGSGIYCNNKLTGVLSSGTGCGKGSIPGVYIQIRMYEDWINEQLNREDIPKPGPTAPPRIFSSNGAEMLGGIFTMIIMGILSVVLVI